MRVTIRARLTLLYGGLFLSAGIALLALTYLLVRHNLQQSGPNQSFMSTPKGVTIVTNGPLTNQEKQWVETYQSQVLKSLLTQGAIALTFVGAAAIGLGWLMAGRALRPVHLVTETARRVYRSSNLSERIAYTGPHDEIKELADTFDTMLGRLARAFDSQRRFVANASHELRTPLAINRTMVDVAVRRTDVSDDARRLGESLLIVNARHERLIEGLLTLADSEQPSLDTRPLDLAKIAEHVMEQSATEASDADVTRHHQLRPAPTTGDPVLLERLVQNLVENAIRHNQAGGEFEVTTQIHSHQAELVVTNTGPKVPAYDIDTIFEPFRRLHADRLQSDRGNGLGLSIVRAIANAHGGSVTAEPRDHGGLTISVVLPTPHDPTPRLA